VHENEVLKDQILNDFLGFRGNFITALYDPLLSDLAKLKSQFSTLEAKLSN
jgi:hypothetical protein